MLELREQAAFLAAVQSVLDEAVMAFNPAAPIMEIAEHLLAGEIAFRRGSIDESVAQLRKAIAVEDMGATHTAYARRRSAHRPAA